MSNMFVTTYPIRNKYEYFLPQLQLFNSDNIGRLRLLDINIYTEPSYHDCPSDDHRFNTFHCNNVGDHDVAWVIGLELMSLLRGLVTIFCGEEYQRNIKLEKMKIDGEYIEYPTSQLGYEVDIKLGFYQELGRNLINNLFPTERQAYRQNAKNNVWASSLYIAQTNIGLYLILKYFSEPLTWSSLYKIMETLMTIQDHHDKEWKMPWTNADKKKFTNPANNFSLVGIDSRHGFKPDSLQPNNSPKMTLNEAKEMFIKCANSYLNFKFNELRQNQ